MIDIKTVTIVGAGMLRGLPYFSKTAFLSIKYIAALSPMPTNFLLNIVPNPLMILKLSPNSDLYLFFER